MFGKNSKKSEIMDRKTPVSDIDLLSYNSIELNKNDDNNNKTKTMITLTTTTTT